MSGNGPFNAWDVLQISNVTTSGLVCSWSTLTGFGISNDTCIRVIIVMNSNTAGKYFVTDIITPSDSYSSTNSMTFTDGTYDFRLHCTESDGLVFQVSTDKGCTFGSGGYAGLGGPAMIRKFSP